MIKGGSILFWLFTIFGIPITFPWVGCYLFTKIQMKKRKKELREKVVMITGASSGLGEALAHAFYRCGCKLILVARRKLELERVKNTLLHTHYTVPTHPPIILAVDLTEIASLQTEVDKVLSIHGQIDILINNAGMSYRGMAKNTQMNVDTKVMMINYFAQIALTKAILPSMIKQQSGHIVCISSVQGKMGIPYRSAYSASKHALQAWCDCLRAELFDTNILVSVISPGYIKTSLSLNAVTETGENYGQMDKSTLEGYSSEYVADKVLEAVLKRSKEVMIAPLTAKLANFIRYMIPSLYFKIMQMRAKKYANSKLN
ncbi:dehydrogenase/reductase SDR family protein 7-like [Chelonus insularis]|uniref:dehydrogenase/reductase SDR family protein 7-like n=1 Tax=Chelonus insularis TaxID=460826 RepID=UPI00158DBF05|nr:dehydrogenase/reductase SDR family protein 7-like [Chelonus insularis]